MMRNWYGGRIVGFGIADFAAPILRLAPNGHQMVSKGLKPLQPDGRNQWGYCGVAYTSDHLGIRLAIPSGIGQAKMSS